jgi:hypothetical protein
MENYELGKKVSWPVADSLPKEAEIELAKLLYQAQLDEVKARCRRNWTS